MSSLLQAENGGSDSVIIRDDETNATTFLHRVSHGKATIARGAFGEITLAVQFDRLPAKNNLITNLRLVALKTIYMEPQQQQRQQQQNDDITTPTITAHHKPPLDEISCLQRLNPHPFIVKLLDVVAASTASQWSSPFCHLVLPYCHVDLYTSLSWKRQQATTTTTTTLLTHATLLRLASHLFSALQHCHGHGIIHGDVKPGNLLIHVESATLQLSDFGIAFYDSSVSASSYFNSNQPKKARADDNGDADSKNNYYQTIAAAINRRPRALCTLQYRPPEMLLGLNPVTDAVVETSLDLFSAGLVLAECVAGTMLFPGTNDLSQLSLYFQTLGTPTTESWPLLTTLPDWGKLTFVPHPHNPVWYQHAIPRLLEFPNNNGNVLMDIIANTIVLDPSKRWSASKCREMLEQQEQERQNHSMQTAGHRDKEHFKFVQELVPEPLRQLPLLLSPPNDCFDVLDKQIQQIAQTRREYLSSLRPWKEYMKRKQARESKEQ